MYAAAGNPLRSARIQRPFLDKKMEAFSKFGF
jgi:hypothetical protein